MVPKTLALLIATLLLFVSTLAQPRIAHAACVTPVFINEFHYDNVGVDVDEFIEIAGPAGLDLTGWTLVLYNGIDGKPYGSPIDLSGVIPDEADGMGALAFGAPGIQNGSPDGVALVDDMGSVRHLVSYEGSFEATGGPATGLILPDIGVAEGTNTPLGYSLQLKGSGECMDEFTWVGPTSASPGQLNQGQLFSSLPRVVNVQPSDGVYDVAPDAMLVVTFSTAVTIVGPSVIECTGSGVQMTTLFPHSAQAFALPHTDFIGGETCQVTIPAATVLAPGEAPSTMEADYSWQFSVAYTPTNAASLFISDEEVYSRAVVDTQDDLWRSAAQEALSCPNFAIATLQEAKNVQCGDRIGDCILPTTLNSGLVISYTLRNMDGRPLGSGDPWASGHGDGCNGGATLQDGSPRPNGIAGCYYNDAGNFRGSNSNANAVLFTFSEPVAAFGAWFGDLETKPYGTTYYRDGATGGTGSGGAQAFLRLFFEDGAMQESPIEPTLAPGAPWLSASAPPPALPLTAGGDVGYCGGPNAATDADGCGNSSTRWVGFVSDNPQRRVTHMLVAVGDDDHSGAGPSDGPNVVCDGGDGGACNAGTEYLSFIGPTVCVAPDLALVKHVEPESARPGDILTYTLVYSNHVAGVATGPVVITDHLPDGLQFLETIAAEPPALLVSTTPAWQVSSLPEGVVGSVTFSARVAEGVNGFITNTATIEAAGDSNLANNQATATVFLASPRVELRKQTNSQDAPHPPGPDVDEGSTVMWTYTITNSGNVSLGDLLLTDDRIADLTCQEGALPALLPPGGVAMCTVAGAAELGQYVNHAMIMATPVVGSSTPVSATAISYYLGVGYGAVEVVLQAEPQLDQWFTFTTNITPDFALVHAPESNHVNEMLLPHLRAGQPYTITIAPVAGWLLQAIHCTDGTAHVAVLDEASVTVRPTVGETVTCVFTQSAIAPTLSIVKTVLNDNGGVATEADFAFFANAMPMTSGIPATLQVGPYMVTETGPPGYAATFGGDCAADGMVILAPGMNAVCTITNDDFFAALGDWVWLDINRNGLQDVDEPGMSDVAVQLYDQTGGLIRQTVTDVEGRYRFEQLLPGGYEVAFALPPGYAFTAHNTGGDSPNDSDVDPLRSRTQLITLAPNELRGTIDAGLVTTEPVDEEPVDEEPVDEEPVDEEPVDEEPVDEEPVDEEPVDEEPVDEEPVDEEPVDEEPVDEEPVDEEPVDEEPVDEEPVDEEPVIVPQLTFVKRASLPTISLAVGSTQVLTYTLHYSNHGPISAYGVEIIERAPRGTLFHAEASSPGWECAGNGVAGERCHYAIGDLAAHTDGMVVFAVLITNPGEIVDNVVINLAELHADNAVPEPASSGVLLEASANIEVLYPTSLDESNEPERTHRILLPWVNR